MNTNQAPGAADRGSELTEGLGAGAEARRLAARKLDRVESAISYTLATVGVGCHRKRSGEWVEVHYGRATSSERQLSAALKDLQEIRQALLSA